jgi:transketolase
MTDHHQEAGMANAIRALAMDAVQAANSGHPGMPMGMADVATVLFNRFINIDPSAPGWRNRDRFVLSAGHGSMLQYAIHHLLGYADMDVEQLRNFRQLGYRTAGHPEYGHAAGIETTTGPLGQGLANAVGFALAERMANARFGDDLVNHWTYVIAGDGCLMEGISHEAADMAGHLQLGRLIVLWDDNEISIDGSTSLATSTDQAARFEACGWHVVRNVDGHDREAVATAIEAARADGRPSFICCRTVIGFGAPTKAGTAGSHGAPLGAEEIAGARAKLGWDHAPFEIPDDIRHAWQSAAARAARAREDWESRYEVSAQRSAFDAFFDAPDFGNLRNQLQALKDRLIEERPALATRKSSQLALEVINDALNVTIGGSADLTGSNNTLTSDMGVVSAGDFTGRYIHYGVREHAMAAVMNGLALYGGFIPYGGTFLVFTDYARPAIRLSALMGIGVIYVMTHDSIGLGEDGPTHQPVEHLSALRAIPNLYTFRPADSVETAEAWECALQSPERPSVLALSRQNLPTLRSDAHENKVSKGAYILREAGVAPDVVLVATGSEVAIAMEAAEALAENRVSARVVSAPCLELFDRQERSYQRAVLGDAPRVIVEAGIRWGWDRWLRTNDAFIGMHSFGVSAPYQDAYAHFGLTTEATIEAALRLLEHA